MKDTIIKGTGNSRSIKAPANLKQQITDLDSLLDLLIAGLPCDIGPLNEAGCQQIGDSLNKENLLKDTTAALYGLTGEAVPDEVLVKARGLITAVQSTASERAKIEYGYYKGSGSQGQSTPNSLSFSFSPAIVMIPFCRINNLSNNRVEALHRNSNNWIMYPPAITTSYGINCGFGEENNNSITHLYGKKSNDGKTIYWYSTYGTAAHQFNATYYDYYYVAIG